MDGAGNKGVRLVWRMQAPVACRDAWDTGNPGAILMPANWRNRTGFGIPRLMPESDFASGRFGDMIAWAGSLAGDNDRESFEDALSYAAADPELQRQAVQDQLATDAQAAAVIALPKSVLIDCKGFCGHVDAEGLALSQSSREQQRLVDDLLDRSGVETNDYGDVEDLVYALDDAREAMLFNDHQDD